MPLNVDWNSIKIGNYVRSGSIFGLTQAGKRNQKDLAGPWKRKKALLKK